MDILFFSANSWLMNSPDCCKVTRMMHPIQERHLEHGDISSGMSALFCETLFIIKLTFKTAGVRCFTL